MDSNNKWSHRHKTAASGWSLVIERSLVTERLCFLKMKPQASAPLLHCSGLFSFQYSIMHMYWKLASFILPSSPCFTVQSAVQTPEAHNSPACFIFLPGIVSLLISWWPQAPPATIWEHSSWRMTPACLQKPGSSWCVEAKAPDAVFMNDCEFWGSSSEPANAACCGWMLTMRWCTALALSEIYG